MRADRVLSLLLLLQTRGRMTAQQLATELEVSVRTVYRDIDALGAAGVPLYADRGRAGGYRLLDGYRTRLTGLTGDQAGSLFLAGMPGPAAELGLGAELAAAELKLLAALPEESRGRAERLRERFHLDAPGWFRETEPVPHLGTLADAVWNQRRLRMRYRRWKAPREVWRTVCPLGVVLKAGVWYLVAAPAGESALTERRVYRVAHVLDVEPSEERFERPEGFDLAGYWGEWARRFEAGVLQGEAEIRISPRGLERMGHLLWSGAGMARAARAAAGPPDADGWVRTVVPIESLPKAHADLLTLGAEVEVLAPAELRAMVADTARVLAARYGPSAADRPETDRTVAVHPGGADHQGVGQPPVGRPGAGAGQRVAGPSSRTSEQA